MPTMLNPRSQALLNANPRLLTSPNSDVFLSATTPIFHVSNTGDNNPSVITFNAILIAMDGTVTFTCDGGTLSSVVGNTAALQYVNMTGDSATVTATITYRNQTYSDSVIITKVYDGAAGGTGLNNALVYAYQRSATQPAGSPGAVQYSFTAAGITTNPLANGWLKTIPAGTLPLWITGASASSSSSTDTIAANEWSESVVFAKNGDDGVSPALMSLSATSQSFTYNGTGAATPTSQTISFTANLKNTTGTAVFTCTKYDASGASLGTVTMGGTGNTRTLTVAQFTTSSARAVVTATINGLSDTTTVVRLADGVSSNGVSALAGYLTNENITVPSASNGSSPVFSGVSGNFKVFQGTTDVTADCTFAIVGSPVVATTAPTNGTGAYSVTGAGTWADNSLTTNVTYRATHTPSSATIDQVLTLTKAPAGVDGSSPAILALTSSAQVFTYNGTGVATPSSQTITFTAGLKNVTGTATFTCTKYDSAGASLGTVTLGGSGNSRTLTIAQFTTSSFRAVITATLGTLSDTVTVVRLADGAAGSGVSAIAGYLTNENVTVPSASDGSSPVLTGVSGNFKVFQGTTDVTSGCTFSVVGTPLVTTTAPSAGAGAYSVTAAGTWPSTSLTTSVTYRASHTASGATIDQVLTITKAPAGVQGDAGVNSATITVYRRTATTVAPAKPSAATTYTFTPPSLSGLNNSWTTTIPAASSGAYLWATTATAVATTATDTIAAAEWATPQMITQDGAKGDRGNVQVARAITGSVWSDSEAALAISGAGYGVPQNRDIVTLYNNSVSFSQQKYYDGSAWQILAAYFPGGVIVDGTVDATKINSRGLDIKDTNGNVILSSGTSLAQQAATNPNLVPNCLGWPGQFGVSASRNGDPRFGDGQFFYMPTTTSAIYVGAESPTIGLPQNSLYTVSFDAYCTGSARTLNADIQAAVASPVFDSVGLSVSLTNVLARYSFTETTPSNNSSVALGRLRFFTTVAGGSDIVIANIKVELGSKVTPWCDNIITPANASTFIASAAINLAQINTASITNLSALSAIFGNAQLGPNGALRQGSTSYGVGNGVYLGADSNGNPVFSLVSGAKKVLFDPANNVGRLENFDVVTPQMTINGVPATINGGSGLPNDTAWRVYGSFTTSTSNAQGAVSINGFINVTEGEMRLSQSGNTFTVSGRGSGAGTNNGRSNSATIIITATDANNRTASAQSAAFGSHGTIQ